jgi:pimeloyl-ACP methyl ester carboxylesterase
MSRQDRAVRPAGQPARDRLLAAIPLTEQRRQLAGVATAVLEGGDGPPVVLLHGHGEFAAVWLRVIPDLVRSHRLVVPDLPGHGASEVTDGPLDTGQVLRWLGELVDQTCPTPPVVAGHLLGGAIAARYAVDHGDRLARLVLVDTMGLGWFRPAPSFAIPMIRFVARPTARSRDRVFDRCFLDHDRVGEDTGEAWEWLRTYALDRARTPSVQAALRRLMLRLGLPPIPPGDLARIGVPTTLIHGRHDLQVRLRLAEAASARYGWPLHVIEDCRDDPAFEQPDAFVSALRAALE